MRRWLARLVDAEVRRLTAERDMARRDRNRAVRVAVRWHGIAQIQEARADALATINVGRCGDRLDAEIGEAAPCALPAGHTGWHRADNSAGTEWGPITNTKEQ